MRTIVDLPEQDLQAIKDMARRENTSQAEMLRRAVRLYLETRREQVDPHVFGIWHGRQDGVGYQQALRDEWDP